MRWNSVKDELPEPNTEILMAWAEERAVKQGKFFGKETSLNGFATPSGKGPYWVGKIGVSHWCYLDDALPVARVRPTSESTTSPEGTTP